MERGFQGKFLALGKGSGSECPDNLIADPGFEAGSSLGAWTQASSSGFSIFFFDVLAARSGNWSAFFGGGTDVATLTQTVQIPVGSAAELTFYLFNAFAPQDANDTFEVLVDGVPLFQTVSGDPRFTTTYGKVSVNLLAFADGNLHNIRFRATVNMDSAFLVDDVCLVVTPLAAEGEAEGETEGEFETEGEPAAEGEGEGEGIAEGEGETEGAAEGEGFAEGETEGEFETEGEGAAEGEDEGAAEGGFEGEGVAEGETEGEIAAEGEGEEEGEGVALFSHSADVNGDGRISLSELLRVIQFFNSGGLQCAENTEDGYAPGLGDTDCPHHSSDYAPANWQINLSELLRLIQIFNVGGYYACPAQGTEDGFCIGTPP